MDDDPGGFGIASFVTLMIHLKWLAIPYLLAGALCAYGTLRFLGQKGREEPALIRIFALVMVFTAWPLFAAVIAWSAPTILRERKYRLQRTSIAEAFQRNRKSSN